MVINYITDLIYFIFREYIYTILYNDIIDKNNIIKYIK